MENEKQNTSVSKAQTIPQKAAQLTNKVSEILKQNLGLMVLVLILLGTTSFLAHQNYQLKQQLKGTQRSLPQKIMISPSPALPSQPTVDPTVNWETHEYSDLKFEVKFPQGWVKRGGYIEPPYWYDPAKEEKIIVALGEISFWEEPNEKRTIDITTFDLNNPNHRSYFQENLDTTSSIETIKIGERSFKKYNDVAIPIAPGSTRNFTYWTLEESGLGAKIMIGDRFAGSDLSEGLIRQILSTFKFID